MLDACDLRTLPIGLGLGFGLDCDEIFRVSQLPPQSTSQEAQSKETTIVWKRQIAIDGKAPTKDDQQSSKWPSSRG